MTQAVDIDQRSGGESIRLLRQHHPRVGCQQRQDPERFLARQHVCAQPSLAIAVQPGLEMEAQRCALGVRRRQWNPGENKWMGWERKRGKLEEFNRLLRGFIAECEKYPAVAGGK